MKIIAIKNEEAREVESHPGYFVNAAAVKEIRKLLAQGHTQTSLAARFGVSVMTISNIGRRVAWKHVT